MSNYDNLRVKNFRNICRTCLAEGTMMSLYEKCPEEVRLVEMLMSITCVQVLEKDNFPVQICLNCVTELTRAYKFVQRSLEVDKQLKNYFQEYEDNINSNIISIPSEPEQIKTEIDVEENQIEINPEVVLIKTEIFSEEENSDYEDNDESDDSDDSDSSTENKRLWHWNEMKHPMKETISINREEKDKSFGCGACGKGFVCKSKLLRHQVIHTRQKSYNLRKPAVMECDEEVYPPVNIRGAIKNVELNLLPKKSKKIYEESYVRFMDYRKENIITTFSEDVFIEYFAELSKKMKPSTLLATYSMLKATLNVNDNVDLTKCSKLRAFLKHQSDGYQPKISKTLEKHQIIKFLFEAPDETYLTTKVALVFGIAGACRCEELLQMTIGDIEDMGGKLLITLPATKTKKSRLFVVTKHLEIFRKYAAHRPLDLNSQRFFFKFTNGKASKQLIGIHKFGNMPQEIAAFLKLSNIKDYTGHCFRRTSLLLCKSNK